MLNGDYIRGLVDGEGCFNVKVWQDKRPNRTYRVEVKFFIALRDDNYHLLEKVKDFFQCGRIELAVKAHGNKKTQWRYVVARKEELANIIIPFFENYPLIGAKKKDYDLFKEAVNLFTSKKHLYLTGQKFPRPKRRLVNPQSVGFIRIEEIAKTINEYRNSLEPKKA